MFPQQSEDHHQHWQATLSIITAQGILPSDASCPCLSDWDSFDHNCFPVFWRWTWPGNYLALVKQRFKHTVILSAKLSSGGPYCLFPNDFLLHPGISEHTPHQIINPKACLGQMVIFFCLQMMLQMFMQASLRKEKDQNPGIYLIKFLCWVDI